MAGRRLAIGVASALHYLTGLSGGLSHIAIVAYYFARHEKPVVLGITMDSGAFDRLGWTEFGVAMGLFVLPCAADVVAGRWLQQRRRRGGVLSLALVPVEMVFAIGLGLPLWVLVVPVRAVLVAAGWKELRPD